MTYPTIVKELVIKGYFEGKSFDEISNENNIAKGSVFNIIHRWKTQLEIPDIEAIREFSIMVRKSGITIKQCAQGFRFIQILTSFGIKDELDSKYVEDKMSRNIGEDEYNSVTNISKNNRTRKDHVLTSRDTFYYFIETIYNYCKSQNIRPTNVIQWIQDLVDISPLLYSTAGNNAIRYESDFNEAGEFQDLSTINKPIFKSPAGMSNDKVIQIPFISEIDGYIEQKKLKIQDLDSNIKKLLQKTKDLDHQKTILVSKLTDLKRKESIALSYLDWYKSIEKDLLDRYDIVLEKEVNSFVNMFGDFKYYDYDAHQIVKEYKHVVSLRNVIKNLQGIIKTLDETRVDTISELESLEKRENYSRQSLNALQELSYAGFDLSELKQLKEVVSEIAVSNDIELSEAGKKFLTDVKNQYNNKLGFETKIKEIKTEMKKLEDEMPGYKEYLQSQVFISRTLESLYKSGVTNDDIINMTDVVTAYSKGDITFDPNLQYKNKVDKKISITMSQYWKSLISEIRNLGDINSQNKKQSSYLGKLKEEIDNLNSQRQKLNEQTLLSIQILNSLNNRLSYFVDSLKEIFVSAKDQNKMFIVYQPLFFIHVTASGNSKDENSMDKDK